MRTKLLAATALAGSLGHMGIRAGHARAVTTRPW